MDVLEKLLNALEPFAAVDCTPVCLGTGYMLVKTERWVELKCLVLDESQSQDYYSCRVWQYASAERICSIVESHGWLHNVIPRIELGAQCEVRLDIRHKDY